MREILVVSKSEIIVNVINELLSSSEKPSLKVIKSGVESRRLISSFDLIIINTPLNDEFGHDLAIFFAQTTTAGILLLVKSEIEDDIASKVEDYGVVVLGKPINRMDFFRAIKLVSVTSNRIGNLRNENIALQNKLKEIKIIDRAKLILIQHLNMTEAEAHRYIEKQAMDLRLTKAQVASNILSTYCD